MRCPCNDDMREAGSTLRLCNEIKTCGLPKEICMCWCDRWTLRRELLSTTRPDFDYLEVSSHLSGSKGWWINGNIPDTHNSPSLERVNALKRRMVMLPFDDARSSVSHRVESMGWIVTDKKM